MTLYRPSLPTRGPTPTPASILGSGVEMSRLINAALVNRGFCDQLLTNPSIALSKGYNGEAFQLSAPEMMFTLTVHAESLTDFAARWVMYENGLSAVGEVYQPIMLKWMNSL